MASSWGEDGWDEEWVRERLERPEYGALRGNEGAILFEHDPEALVRRLAESWETGNAPGI